MREKRENNAINSGENTKEKGSGGVNVETNKSDNRGPGVEDFAGQETGKNSSSEKFKGTDKSDYLDAVDKIKRGFAAQAKDLSRNLGVSAKGGLAGAEKTAKSATKAGSFFGKLGSLWKKNLAKTTLFGGAAASAKEPAKDAKKEPSGQNAYDEIFRQQLIMKAAELGIDVGQLANLEQIKSMIEAKIGETADKQAEALYEVIEAYQRGGIEAIADLDKDNAMPSLSQAAIEAMLDSVKDLAKLSQEAIKSGDLTKINEVIKQSEQNLKQALGPEFTKQFEKLNSKHEQKMEKLQKEYKEISGDKELATETRTAKLENKGLEMKKAVEQHNQEVKSCVQEYKTLRGVTAGSSLDQAIDKNIDNREQCLVAKNEKSLEAQSKEQVQTADITTNKDMSAERAADAKGKIESAPEIKSEVQSLLSKLSQGRVDEKAAEASKSNEKTGTYLSR